MSLGLKGHPVILPQLSFSWKTFIMPIFTVYHANFHSVVFNFDHCYDNFTTKVSKSKEKHCFIHYL